MPGRPELRRPVAIAMLARRYRLMADRPEFMISDPGERIDKAYDTAYGNRHVIDRTLIAAAGEVDRLCAAAVRLSSPGGHRAALLDVLGYLDADTICAVWWALPEARRPGVERDPVVAHHVEGTKGLMDEAEAWLTELYDEQTPSPALDALANTDPRGLAEYNRARVLAAKRRAGLAADSSPEEDALAAETEPSSL